MGAPRLSPPTRALLTEIAEDLRSAHTGPDGSIDRKGLSRAISTALMGHPALRVTVAREGTDLAIASFVADLFRDRKNRSRIGSRNVKLREVYSVPVAGGKWVTKATSDLTTEDMERIEEHIRLEAATRLQEAKDIRTLRGFTVAPADQTIIDPSMDYPTDHIDYGDRV